MGTAPDDKGGYEERCHIDAQDEPPIELNRHGVDVIDGGIQRNEVELLLNPAQEQAKHIAPKQTLPHQHDAELDEYLPH